MFASVGYFIYHTMHLLLSNNLKVPKTKRDEIERLERVGNKYARGQIQHIDWLDRLTFRAVDKIEEGSERTENSYPSLIIELCSFEHRVVFQVVLFDH